MLDAKQKANVRLLYLTLFSFLAVCIVLLVYSATQLSSTGKLTRKIASPASNTHLSSFDEVEFLRDYEQLDFMVWEYERTELRARLQQQLHSQITQNPINFRYWYWLLQLLVDDPSADPQELSWVFQRAVRLSFWDIKLRAKVSAACVHRYQSLSQFLPEQCTTLFKSFGNVRNSSVLARMMGISHEQLQEFLESQRIHLAFRGK